MTPKHQTRALRRNGMGRLAAKTAAAAIAASVLAGLWSVPALAQGKIKESFGDWNLVCDTPPGAAAEQCALVQSVIAEDQQNVGLTVIVLRTADGSKQLLRVLAPLGVLLPAGLGLKIDDADIGRAGFVRCLNNGCIAEVEMQDDFIQKLTAGQLATFIIFKTPEQGVGIPVSLNGLASGIGKL